MSEVHKCSECSFISKQPGKLKIHKDREHEGLRFACALCECHYARKSHLTDHIRSKHDGKIPCTLCDKKFSKTSELKNHLINVHTLQLFICSLCENPFKVLSNLKTHMRTKHGTVYEPLVKKEIKCDFLAANKEEFIKHTNEEHSMDECNAGYLPCTDCSYITKRSDHMREHIKIKHEQILHKCEMCGLETFNPRFFKRHKKNRA